MFCRTVPPELGWLFFAEVLPYMPLGLPGLTRREGEVARLLIQGAINKEIGSTLGITERTVKGHRSAIYRKLNIKSVAELAAFIPSAYAVRWRADPNGACNWVSTELLSFLGTTEGRQYGDGWLDGLHPDDRESAEAGWREAFSTRTNYLHLHRHLQADGSTQWVFDLGFPSFDAQGRYLGHYGVIVPIDPDLAHWLKS